MEHHRWPVISQKGWLCQNFADAVVHNEEQIARQALLTQQTSCETNCESSTRKRLICRFKIAYGNLVQMCCIPGLIQPRIVSEFLFCYISPNKLKF